MPHVYRRPFDYPQRRQAFNVWSARGVVGADVGAAAFTAHKAAVTSTASTDQYSRSTRFSTQGIYRKRWPYAEHNARIILNYKDADVIEGQLGAAALTGHEARVQLGKDSGANIVATLESAGFSTYLATLEGSRRDPVSVGAGVLITFGATLVRTAGLGQSRTGATSAKPSGTYTPGTTRSRRARVVSRTNQIVKAK